MLYGMLLCVRAQQQVVIASMAAVSGWEQIDSHGIWFDPTPVRGAIP